MFGGGYDLPVSLLVNMFDTTACTKFSKLNLFLVATYFTMVFMKIIKKQQQGIFSNRKMLYFAGNAKRDHQ